MTAAEQRIRVLLADDEPLIRAGVGAVLATDPAIELVAEAADGREAVDGARSHRPDVVLLDLQMPVTDGHGALTELIRVMPEIKIIVLTTFGAEENIRRALTAGAAGFLLKASDPREMITAVHAVADGGAYLSPRIAGTVIAGYRTGADPTKTRAADQVGRLTEREREVLTLVTVGLSNAEIGRRMFMVEGTVKGHVSSILTKLDVQNRVQAAILGYQAGLADDRP
ncbi:response regulator [Microlunatus soli]|uniref:DNA-binding response regulator, NarL/FixJ family, contains REC and HTH domains n=1 Tax=Microlunatus soli TaxID=630515 RepID=A0A1H1SVC2_9ACTN|nr:response regulator transcription factor [Microlunatus soli]SDS51915.1 DNA-binding response regulator, NarL/FixJ family, contains REC and HTH domains [Microlunatus soli]